MFRLVAAIIIDLIVVLATLLAAAYCVYLGAELTTEDNIPTIVVGWVLIVIAMIIPPCVITALYERN